MVDMTRREALESAFEEVTEKTEPTVTPTEVSGKPDEYQVEAAAAARDTQTEVKTEPQPTETEKVEVKAEESAAPVEPVKTEDEVPAPISWKAEEKALWAKVPKEVRTVIQRRELEVQRALSTTAQARRFTEDFGRVVSPYAHLIRAQNSTPLAAVDNLMRTAAGLTVGTQQQKAAIIAEIISNYNVDVQELDRTLSQAPQNPNAGRGDIPPQFAQALQPLYQFVEQVQTQRQTYEQRQAEKVAAEIESFGANRPFFEEVREDMADIIDTGARRGKVVTLEQAYNAAIAANPTYADAVRQQNRASEVSQAASTLARARKAASSVTGSPSSASLTSKTPANRREAIEQAWNNTSQG